MSDKQIKFWLAVASQVLVILIIVVFKVSILSEGNDVLLRIVPVDPRDWLRGDYVTFSYDISSLSSYYANRQNLASGDTIYVVLRQGNKYATVSRVQKEKPSEKEIFIKGKIASGGVSPSNDDLMDEEFNNRQLRVIYGIEQYFIPEGSGQNFNFPDKTAAAQVFLDSNGNAVLKRIYIDDKPWP